MFGLVLFFGFVSAAPREDSVGKNVEFKSEREIKIYKFNNNQDLISLKI